MNNFIDTKMNVITTQIVIPLLTVPVAFFLANLTQSAEIKEIFFYLISLVILAVSLLTVYATAKHIKSMYKEKDYDLQNIAFVIFVPILFLYTYYVTLFSGLILVGFS